MHQGILSTVHHILKSTVGPSMVHSALSDCCTETALCWMIKLIVIISLRTLYSTSWLFKLKTINTVS